MVAHNHQGCIQHDQNNNKREDKFENKGVKKALDLLYIIERLTAFNRFGGDQRHLADLLALEVQMNDADLLAFFDRRVDKLLSLSLLAADGLFNRVVDFNSRLDIVLCGVFGDKARETFIGEQIDIILIP